MKASSYRVTCRAVVQRRGSPPPELPQKYKLVLLKSAPKPEGGLLDEIDAPEYVGQPLRWISAIEGAAMSPTIRNANRVLFGPATAWQQATHAGIVDEHGDVVAYGFLETAPGHAGHDEVTFESTAIQLRFL